eukprot:3501450-Pleurochrysis_carterae.AAC.1
MHLHTYNTYALPASFFSNTVTSVHACCTHHILLSRIRLSRDLAFFRVTAKKQQMAASSGASRDALDAIGTRSYCSSLQASHYALYSLHLTCLKAVARA